MLAGGCHCGDVRYEVRGEAFEPVICHCADCRGVSGAPVLAWFSVSTPDFRYVRGAPVRYASTGRAVREFCGACGTQITFAQHDLAARQIDVTTASLDDPERTPPFANIFFASRIAWMPGIGALPEIAGDFTL